LPRRDAVRGLHELRDGCTAAQLELRVDAFSSAEAFINRGRIDAGTVPLRRTFRNRNLPLLRKDARVDIDVFSGIAFV
jgi:hypothetical protein